ncbi:transporter substrate-binding domain-containing protein [[Empedobacter] haloabium]|uniref:Transporter substrate-binding domain-containing protein n=1 Tax=[Empedobacter] haloabium TaxID=592317 RepID=A0ABZ1UR62_9BURK
MAVRGNKGLMMALAARRGRGWAARLAGLGLALAAPWCAAAPLSAEPTLTLCYERANVRPWRTEAGEGLNFDLLRMVGERERIVFVFQSMPFKRCLAQLKANAVDGVFAVSFKPDRLELGAYPGGATPDASKRMHIDRYILLRRKGGTLDWDGKTLHNVDGAIGAQLGYSITDQLRSLNVTVDEGSQKSEELVRKLLAGRLAGAAVGGSDARTLLDGPYGRQIEALPVPLVEKPYFLMLSHQLVARQPELASRIWSAVEQVRNSPAYKKLERTGSKGARR